MTTVSTLQSVNPVNDEIISTFTIDSREKTEIKLNNAQSAFLKWKDSSIQERLEALRKVADYIIKNKDLFAKTATLEMGKPYAQSLSEVEKCTLSLRYYAENGSSFLEPEVVKTEARKSVVCFQPLGVILAIMPWNFPYWQVFRAMGPILLAGNTMVLKHASNVMGCSLLIEKALEESGLPDHIFQSLIVPSSDVKRIIEHKHIQAITLTGSTKAGSEVASVAAGNLKKQVLELGGSDPYIVLEDADIDLAVNVCVQSRLINPGQSCIAAKRFIIDKKIIKTFTEKMVQLMEEKRFGDPMNSKNDLGPLARRDLRDELHEQVMKCKELGAKVLCGGFIPEGAGAFYPPTVLSHVKKGMPGYDDELFGPVAAIIEAEDENDAINIANDTVFGLGAAIFSENLEKAEKIAMKIEAGSVFINELVSSNPKLPFGGIKQSGYGRELSYFAVREFSNIKTVLIH